MQIRHPLPPAQRCIAYFAALLALVLCLGSLPSAASALTQPTAALSLSAQASILMDAEGGEVLYAQNADTRLPMASTTKIMTALVVVDQLHMTDPVCIDSRAVGIEGSSIYLYAGEWLTVEQLLMGLLLESANDAAVALALACCDSLELFAEQMNQKAAELGLTNTHFDNPHGLDSETHYTTARELARIAQAALAHPELRTIMSTRRATIPLCDMRGPQPKEPYLETGEELLPVGSRVLLNHNKMLRYYDGAIGVKTGYTKRSGRCLVSAAERDGLTLIAVTLNAPDDWSDHTSLLDYGFSRYTAVTLCGKGEYQTRLPVSGGKESYVMVSNPDSLTVTLPRDHGSISCRVELPRFLIASVKKQQPLGALVFSCDIDGDGQRETIGRVPLITLYDVEATPPPSLLSRILSFIKQCFFPKASR